MVNKLVILWKYYMNIIIVRFYQVLTVFYYYYRYLEANSKKGIALCVLDRSEEATLLLFDCLKFVDQTDPKVC